MRARYWSCTKLADWIRGTPKLAAGTVGEWKKWRVGAKQAHAIRYWVAEELLDRVQGVIHWVPDKVNDVRYWLQNRFVTKTHALTSNLSRGEWHEFDARLLHSMFDSFVDFIEIEKAWAAVMFDDDAKKKYHTPWWRKQWYTRWFLQWRSPSAGVDYLHWEMSLKYDESWLASPDDPLYGKPTSQAESAAEQWELYYWWKFVRPGRIDPMKYSGWNDYCDSQPVEDLIGDPSDGDKDNVKTMLSNMDTLERKYAQEDEDMMIRLIKIRQSLWT